MVLPFQKRKSFFHTSLLVPWQKTAMLFGMKTLRRGNTMIDRNAQTRLYELYMLDCWEAWDSAQTSKRILKEDKEERKKHAIS